MIQKGALPPHDKARDFQAPAAPLAQTQPGTGGPAVSPPGQQGVENTPVAPAGAGAVAQQSTQLLQSVPAR